MTKLECARCGALLPRDEDGTAEVRMIERGGCFVPNEDEDWEVQPPDTDIKGSLVCDSCEAAFFVWWSEGKPKGE